MVCETHLTTYINLLLEAIISVSRGLHLTTYINLLLEAIISVSRGLFRREPYGYQIHSQMSRVQHFPHNS